MSAQTLALFVFVIVAVRSGAGKLQEFSSSQPHQISGTYIGRDGVHGITFISKDDGHLLVRSLGGEIIVETGPFFEMDGNKVRNVTIKGHKYLQHSISTHSDKPVDHDTPFYHAIQKLLGMKEVTLLREAAEAVSKKGNGITGNKTPAAMPFYMFAFRITQLHTEGPYNTTSPLRSKRESYKDCLDQDSCPPCPDYECYGMCGYGCWWCWKFLCGDCCDHIGCRYHDACCRENFWQTRCLLPYDFSCEEVYAF